MVVKKIFTENHSDVHNFLTDFSVFDYAKEKTVKVIKTVQKKLNVLSIKRGLQHTADKQFAEAFEKRMIELERTISDAIFGGKVFKI